MPIEITINNITGASPYDIFLCDTGTPPVQCVYIDTITSGDLSYTFEVPSIMESMTSFKIKVVDDNDCSTLQLLNLP